VQLSAVQRHDREHILGRRGQSLQSSTHLRGAEAWGVVDLSKPAALYYAPQNVQVNAVYEARSCQKTRRCGPSALYQRRRAQASTNPIWLLAVIFLTNALGVKWTSPLFVEVRVAYRMRTEHDAQSLQSGHPIQIARKELHLWHIQEPTHLFVTHARSVAVNLAYRSRILGVSNISSVPIAVTPSMCRSSTALWERLGIHRAGVHVEILGRSEAEGARQLCEEILASTISSPPATSNAGAPWQPTASVFTRPSEFCNQLQQQVRMPATLKSLVLVPR
jgi:hypothetical protein